MSYDGYCWNWCVTFLDIHIIVIIIVGMEMVLSESNVYYFFFTFCKYVYI